MLTFALWKQKDTQPSIIIIVYMGEWFIPVFNEGSGLIEQARSQRALPYKGHKGQTWVIFPQDVRIIFCLAASYPIPGFVSKQMWPFLKRLFSVTRGCSSKYGKWLCCNAPFAPICRCNKYFSKFPPGKWTGSVVFLQTSLCILCPCKKRKMYW